MSSVSGRWLLVEWEAGDRSVVNVRCLVGGRELHIGDQVNISSRGGNLKQGILVAVSDDRRLLIEQEIRTSHAIQKVEPTLYEEPEQEDFSPSASSWGPESQPSSPSEHSDQQSKSKKIKLENIHKQYSDRSTRKTLTPTLRPEAVVPKSYQQMLRDKKLQGSKRKSKPNKSMVQQAIPDSTRSQICASPQVNEQPIQTNNMCAKISYEELHKVKNDLRQVKEMIMALKSSVTGIKCFLRSQNNYEMITPTESREKIPVVNNNEPGKDEEQEPVVENVEYGLIKHNSSKDKENKPDAVLNGKVAASKRNSKKKRSDESASSFNNSNDDDSDEMVPIGSGKTMVPKSLYKKINWEQYTTATRKLLMAVFPRRVLATHSLTGKASPAFLDKPAKLCLDPKKVFDIVLTVTKNSGVKEGLVRSAITTKCADEYKMLKMRSVHTKQSKSKTRCSLNPVILNGQPSLDTPTSSNKNKNGISEAYRNSLYNQTL